MADQIECCCKEKSDNKYIILYIIGMIHTVLTVSINLYTYLGISLSALIQISNKPRRIAVTSMYGCHTEKPRPNKSIAALRIGALDGSLHC